VSKLAPLLAAWLLIPAPSGDRIFARMSAAVAAQAQPVTERAILDTKSAGMTFAVALRGTALDVEFPFPGPAVEHRYRLASDRRALRAEAERIDARGTVVAGPLRGRAAALYPLTAAEVFGFIATYAGAPRTRAVDGSGYRIVDRGRDPLGGDPAEHLQLIPLRDPRTHPFTDVYVDARSGLPRSIHADVVDPASPNLHLTFTFDFGLLDGRWIARESFLEARLGLGASVSRVGRLEVRVERAVFDQPLPVPKRRLF